MEWISSVEHGKLYAKAKAIPDSHMTAAEIKNEFESALSREIGFDTAFPISSPEDCLELPDKLSLAEIDIES